MTRLRQKLNSTRGASIVIALVYFLLCLTVGAVVMTAATANAGRINRLEQEQQAYFAVRSAAELLRDDLAGLKFSATYEQHYDGDNGGYAKDPTENMSKSQLTQLNGMIQTRAKRLFYNSISPRPQLPAAGVTAETLTVSKVEGVSEVTARYQIADDYSITVTLDTDAEAAYHYPLILSIPATVNGPKTSYRTVEWTTGEGEDEKSHSETIQTNTITVTWQTGTIAKGSGAEGGGDSEP